jgi:peptidoglycan L-alanyl-D-glutamate endopeptidase CwlK
MSITLGHRSIARLQDVHPDLVRVVRRAAVMSSLDFTVLEGLRTLPRQKQLMAQGATRTLNSRHLTGHAVDLAPMIGGTVSWDWPTYYRLADVMRAASIHENVPIRWGGTWKLLSAIQGPITAKILSRSFPDGPHFELPRASYP